jgi:hypothetical protein
MTWRSSEVREGVMNSMYRYYDTRRIGVPSFAGEIGPGRGAGLSTALTAAAAVIAIRTGSENITAKEINAAAAQLG